MALQMFAVRTVRVIGCLWAFLLEPLYTSPNDSWYSYFLRQSLSENGEFV